MSFIAFDFMMSLDSHFYSTLFGVYYFMASVLAALMLAVIISQMLTNKFNLHKIITEMQFYDCGKLMFGLSVFLALHSFMHNFFLYGMQICLRKQAMLVQEFLNSLIVLLFGPF